jgi:hypothetical protein
MRWSRSRCSCHHQLSMFCPHAIASMPETNIPAAHSLGRQATTFPAAGKLQWKRRACTPAGQVVIAECCDCRPLVGLPFPEWCSWCLGLQPAFSSELRSLLQHIIFLVLDK